jgi:hypothetical protein
MGMVGSANGAYQYPSKVAQVAQFSQASRPFFQFSKPVFQHQVHQFRPSFQHPVHQYTKPSFVKQTGTGGAVGRPNLDIHQILQNLISLMNQFRQGAMAAKPVAQVGVAQLRGY